MSTDPIITSGANVELMVVTDKAVYGEMLSRTGNKLFALNDGNGNVLWQKNLDSAVVNLGQAFLVNGELVMLNHSPLTVNDKILDQGLLQGYNSANGALLWSRPLDISFPEAVPGALNGTIYVHGSTFDEPIVNFLYALSAKDGASLWQYRDTGTDKFSSAVATEKGVYIIHTRVSGNPEVIISAVDPKTGNTRWSNEIHTTLVHSAPGVHEDKIYLSLPGNVIQILRGSDGKVLSSFKVNGIPDAPEGFYIFVED